MVTSLRSVPPIDPIYLAAASPEEQLCALLAVCAEIGKLPDDVADAAGRPLTADQR